jgi:carboxyl-terminal processing protease
MPVEKRSRSRSFWLIVFVLVSGGFLGMFAGTRIASTAVTTYEKLDIFSDVLSTVQNTYVDEIAVDKLVYGAIRGMLATLDPHSSFLDPASYKEMQVDTTGQFGGLGIEISIKDNVLTIVSPIEDTPASRAGLQPDDRILSIDGESTQDLSLMDAVKKMRGPRGTKVTIGIMRAGWNMPKDFVLERQVIQIKSVRWERFQGDIGYVRLAQFQERTAADLKKGMKELEAKGKLKGLVLDMRNNPGGLLDQAIEVSDVFIDDGLIVYTMGRLPHSRQEFRARNEGATQDYPIVVLVNGGSASASEIVAGALQDQKRALVMGTATFGKGSVQTIIPMRDGSAMRLTTAKYYTPSGRSIQAKGIEPDIIVEQSLIGELAESGMRVRERDLQRHIGAEDGSDAQPEPEAKKPPTKKSATEQDFQLQRALDLLRGYTIFNSFSDVRTAR